MRKSTSQRGPSRESPPQESREERLARRAEAMMASARATAEHLASIKPRPTAQPIIVRAERPIVACPKEDVVRSKEYTRLVASLPCAWCGIAGFSQAAHDNVGKGMGIKVCDLCTFPLCCDRPGQRGCHSFFDSYALMSREAERPFVAQAIAKTQLHIALYLGWPRSAPMPPELKELLNKYQGNAHVR